MQIDDILKQTGGLSSIARELGLDESQAASGAAALLPAILGGLQQPAAQAAQAAQGGGAAGGLGGLAGVLGQLGGGGLMDEVLAHAPTDVSRGNDLLGHIFGSKDTSRAVAQQAAGTSGVDPALLRRMLPMLVMLVGGYLARQHAATGAGAAGGGGGLGGLLGGLLGGGSPGDAAAGNNPLGDLLGRLGR
jgi:hypothetical protein